MIALIQRVSHADVVVNGEKIAQIGTGFLVLLGVQQQDQEQDVEYLAKKIVALRIFNDTEDKMNLSLAQVGGEILLISQFTLHADTKKGNRPSFIRAAKATQALALYEKMAESLSEKMGKKIQTGIFGADMKVSLLNDGPVTIIMDSKDNVNSA